MIMERTLYKCIFDNKICLIYFGENKVDVFQRYQLSSFMICLEIVSQRMVQCTAVEFVQSDTLSIPTSCTIRHIFLVPWIRQVQNNPK